MRPSPRSLALSVFLVAACGGGGGSSGPDAAPDASFTTGTYRATWGPYTIPPGQEGTKCVEVKLGNVDNIQVHEIHNVLGDASHHFIVYRKADGPERREPYDCQPFTGTLDPNNGAPLMITQRADETLTLPDGVVFTLKPDQLVRLELHYVNATEEPIAVTATAEFRTVLGANQEADFIFAGTPDIDLPSRPTAQTVGPTYLPLQGLGGSNVFAITGHTHELGTDVQVAIATSADDPGTPVYAPTNFSWDEPETVYHAPVFQIPTEGGFRFTCTYVNDTGRRVGFGEGVDDEMCFFWLYYYPSKGAKVCAHTNQFNGPAGIDVCCPAAEGDIISAAACNYLMNQGL
ncbi:MAG: hypothetical protein KBG48_01615 [Kofleriaceae bacterium]|nr:hypothetical protein [Kofleriaceae bacterium]MBP9166044.1 hypothetical protein [Kofleriaceae bacterium]MBP9857277.1 hypothetical protein [Kofleriaceae bacterium]